MLATAGEKSRSKLNERNAQIGGLKHKVSGL